MLVELALSTSQRSPNACVAGANSRHRPVDENASSGIEFPIMSRGSSLLIPVFILVALSILLFSHYFIYHSIVHFFGVASHGRRAMLALLLFLLPASFIVSSILARRMENEVFRLVNFFTGLWLKAAARKNKQNKQIDSQHLFFHNKLNRKSLLII